MREELTDVLYNDDDTISEALAALGFAGFGLGERQGLQETQVARTCSRCTTYRCNGAPATMTGHG
jgi:hypothetical protein